MAFLQQKTPLSELLRQGEPGGSDGSTADMRRSKDEYRRQKELEEQRKAGQVPAMMDIETGRDINPHIPEFITKNPWYVPSEGPTLKHQRPHPERQLQFATPHEWYPKGPGQVVAFKYREGACENCGAMGHKKRDCFEKPRKVGAKWTNSNIAPDDNSLPSLRMGWDAKRDRWAGYNPEDYKQVYDEYQRMEETRRLIRAQQLPDESLAGDTASTVAGENGTGGVGGEGDLADTESTTGIGEEGQPLRPASPANTAITTATSGAPQGPEGDEDMYAEDMAPMQGVDMDSRTRITVRNLRIREDTAKYLHNLDPNGPYYDPKSRSMRENPFADRPDKEDKQAKFAGENFIRYTGEVVDANQAQVFAWQARCKGIDVHALAEPTKLEQLRREFEKEKRAAKVGGKEELLAKYGGAEHLEAVPRELLLAQTENYVEYNRTGKVIRGDERPMVKSRYEEDVYPNNHTSVWGSYWSMGRWGFACCHSFTKQSYCLGEKGLELEKEEAMKGTAIHGKASKQGGDHQAAEKGAKSSTKRAKAASGGESSSNEDSSEDSGSDKSGEEKELDEEAVRLRDEQFAREKEKSLRADHRREMRREKRRRQKEHRRNRPKEQQSKRRRRRNSSDSRSSSASSHSSNSGDEGARAGELEFVAASSSSTSKQGQSAELKAAIKKAKQERSDGKRLVDKGDRQRGYNSNYEQAKAPNAVEVEAYQLTRIHSSDPMAAYMEGKE